MNDNLQHLLSYVAHVAIASGVWSYIRSLPAGVQLAATVGASLVLLLLRRRRRYARL